MPIDLIYFTGGARERVLEAVLAAGHRVSEIFVNDPVRWPNVVPTLQIASCRGIKVTVITRKTDLLKHYDRLRGKQCLSAGYNYLFDDLFLETVSWCINVHGSLLPNYPGARTLGWIIENDEPRSGVTVHIVDRGVDTGAVVLQREFNVSPFETTRSLSNKTYSFEPQVVVEALSIIEQFGFTRTMPQSPNQTTHLNRVPSDGEVDTNLSLKQVFNKIRAADPEKYPAYFYHHGEKVLINLWRPDKNSDEEDLI
ncbi:formyltransferase family protein [Methylobacterium sp. J-070]|uniref:formyltransferase family protein n=1 Tax=Methylobacterium sp. J-070 TaxID=2836650 RepID=UPI001FB9D7D6|nr:formyltransferase family protein [Methylobacterium sp. J-070]MCJ2054921.1 hypothetical protein [Methylobacterium sp. J-070]